MDEQRLKKFMQRGFDAQQEVDHIIAKYEEKQAQKQNESELDDERLC